MILMDVILLTIFVGFCIWAVSQRFIRQLLELVTFYVATIGAGLLYRPAARFVRAIAGNYPTLSQAVMFWVVFLLIVIIMEVALRKSFPDVRLVKIGVLDNILAILPGILCALIISSLLFTTIAHVATPTRGGSWTEAALRPLWSQFLDIYLVLHKLWMPQLPPILAAYLG